MIARFLRFAILVAPLAAMATPAHASPFRYTFEFSQLSFGGATYAADSFSFQVPNLLGFGQTAVVNPPQDLNGLSIASVSVCGSFGASLTYCGPLDFGVPIGSVATFAFIAPGAQAGPGVYPTTDAGRGILTAFGLIQFVYVPGELTIQDVAVPEPATLTLLCLGLGTTLGRRNGDRRTYSAWRS